MNNTTIALMVIIFLSIGTIASTVAVLYAKLKSAISSLVVTDDDGNIKKVKVFDFLRIIISAVTVAEETGKKGAEKKEIALATIQETLNQMGADYDIKELSGAIDTLVGLINAFIKKTKKK